MAISECHVSQKARQQATSRIEAKIKVLQLWSAQGIPVLKDREGQAPALEWFPTSLRQFCSWASESTSRPLDGVGPVAYQTLQAHAEEKVKAASLIKALRVQAAKALEALDPGNRIAALEAELALEREKRAGALLGYRSARQDARRLQGELALERRSHQQTIQLLSTRAEQAERALDDAEVRVSTLTKALATVTPLRKVK